MRYEQSLLRHLTLLSLLSVFSLNACAGLLGLGGTGNDTYVFTGTYGTDIITDSDGQGSIRIGDQTLAGVTYLAENVYKDNASGQIVVRANGGASLIVRKEGEANRILVKDWSETKNLGISLQGSVPAAPAITLTGDFKKATDGNDVLFGAGKKEDARLHLDSLVLDFGNGDAVHIGRFNFGGARGKSENDNMFYSLGKGAA